MARNKPFPRYSGSLQHPPIQHVAPKSPSSFSIDITAASKPSTDAIRKSSFSNFARQAASSSALSTSSVPPNASGLTVRDLSLIERSRNHSSG